VKRERNPLLEMALIVGVAAVYMICAEGGLLLATLQRNASPVWPASGLALAATFRFGRRAAIGIWLGAFFVNLFSPVPFPVAAGIATGNALEAIFAAYLVRKLTAVESEWRFLLRACAYPLAAGAAAALSSTIGTLSLFLGHLVTAQDAFNVASTWWVGDSLGILVFAPLLLSSERRHTIAWLKPERRAEVVAFSLCAAALITFLFFNQTGAAELFLIFPLVLWAATRFGPFEVRFFVVVTAIVSVTGTYLGLGPFHQGALNQNLISLQLFIAALTITSISLGELRDLARLKISTFALLSCWALSAIALFAFERNSENREHRRFESLVTEGQRNIEERMTSYEDALRGGTSFVSASEHIKREEWAAYVRNLHFVTNYPATKGMGLIFPFSSESDPAFTRIKKERPPGFQIRPVPGHEPVVDGTHYVITYIEPELSNDAAVGLDCATESNRRLALEEARDKGIPVATTSIQLVQDRVRRPGLLVVAPAYKPGMPLATVGERRKALQAWVYTPFIAERFFQNAIGGIGNEIEFSVFEISAHSSELEVFRSKSGEAPEHFEEVTTLILGQKPFKIGWRRSKSFGSDRDLTGAFIALSGAMISLLVAMIISSLQLLGERADEIAREKTSLLSEREAVLQKTTRRLQTLIGTSPVAIMAVNRSLLITLWNPACEKIFGWSEAEVMGKKLPFVPTVKRQASDNLTLTVLKTEQGLAFEDERMRKDGKKIYVSTSLMPLFDEEGRCEGVLATTFDRTEERAVQKALEVQRASAIQNARLAALGEMASGIAHEINNPLAIIAAHSNNLLLKLEKDGTVENDRLLTSLKKIETVSFRIARIIKGLRSFARNTEGEPAEVKAIDSIVQDTLEICRERFTNNGIRLEVDVPYGIFVKCQSVQISQVLLNLLNNAFDAAIDSKDPWVRIEAKRKSEAVEISITDSGKGIPEEIADRIAEPFFTTKPVGQGTGLGLSISKGIVEQHHGHLTLVRGSGPTRFTVELPLTNEEPVTTVGEI
jgi:PAS domain S-box-containing protein